MRDGAYFFAPPAGSDSGLRPPQGQSRCKNIRQPSLNNIHKLAKQITPFTSYQDTISFLSEPHRSTPVFYWNRLRAPSLGGEDRIYYFRATYIHLFWNRTGLFYFPKHPTYVPAEPKVRVRPGQWNTNRGKIHFAPFPLFPYGIYLF